MIKYRQNWSLRGNKDVATAENRKEERVRKNKMTKERMQHKKMQRRRKEAEKLKQSSEQNDNDQPKEFEEEIKPESPKTRKINEKLSPTEMI